MGWSIVNPQVISATGEPPSRTPGRELLGGDAASRSGALRALGEIAALASAAGLGRRARAGARIIRLASLAALLVAVSQALWAVEIRPEAWSSPGGDTVGRFSEGTVTAAIEIDRAGARLVGFTHKKRPFIRQIEIPEERSYRGDGDVVRIEVRLMGLGGEVHTQRVDLPGLCLDHAPEAEAHIEGDTIRLHQESLLVELPELAGFDRVEVAYHREDGGAGTRETIGSFSLAPDRFLATDGVASYDELAFATPASGRIDEAAAESAALALGTVRWPSDYGDPDIYTVYGDESEMGSRINIVIVPDGYTYGEKNLMRTHAQALVNSLRNKTPYAEHDRFLNYILVYAYSTESGTDQCDCGIVRNTAMNTRFPNVVATCGSSQNRCLYYGTANGGTNCDPDTTSANITAAELRAPARDQTVIMVNTTRYGGCGGARAVYAAGNASATGIAVHELGHSLGRLADEYTTYTTCGTVAGEINTSRNAATGAWPEWIADLGAPRLGGQYYEQCIYRPTASCDMRTLNTPFCPVCNQQWALIFFGHYRVNPTAPIAGGIPDFNALHTTQVGIPTVFTPLTRLASGPSVTNSVTWLLEGPGLPGQTVVGTGSMSHVQAFVLPGTYQLSCELIAVTNFVKPSRTGANRDRATWTIGVSTVPEVSADPSRLMTVRKAGSLVDIDFEDVGSTRYNLYVSRTPGTLPFKVTGSAHGKRDCGVAGLARVEHGRLRLSGYDLDAGIAGPSDALYFLITADNGPGTEGPMGRTSAAEEREADGYCSR